MYLEKGLAQDAQRILEIVLQQNPHLYPAKNLLYGATGETGT
jgi:hypothetical protein